MGNGWCIGLTVACVVCLATLIYFSEDEKRLSPNYDFLKVAIPLHGRPPVCLNVLQNLTVGKWVKKKECTELCHPSSMKTNVQLEEEIEAHLAHFRIKRGMHTKLWRDDHKCGYTNLQKRPNGTTFGVKVASWCDHKSDKPCCSNEENGVCGKTCDCPECVDLRKILHAEVSEWIPSDARCKRRNYTAEEACEVLKSFPNIYFVGDSYARKMARALVLTLRSDPVYGALLRRYSDELDKLCVGFDGIYWKQCNLNHGNIRNQLQNNKTFCAGNPKTISHNSYWNAKHSANFASLVARIPKEPGNVVFLGVGVHMKLNTTLTSKYIELALRHLRKPHNDSSSKLIWPHIVFMYPDMPGILKPPQFLKLQGRSKCDNFAKDMRLFCDQHDVPILDFRDLTTGVHSYDGSHHGLGVNLMKVQIMLNYLDSLQADMR